MTKSKHISQPRIFMLKLVKSFFVLAWTFSVGAQSVEIKNFSFNYQDPFGQGNATSFNRQKAFGGLDVRIEKISKNFKFFVSGIENHEYELVNAPGFLLNAEKMSVSNLNFLFKDQLNLSVKSVNYISSNESLRLEGLDLFCSRKNSSNQEQLDSLIQGCLQKMSLKSSKFSSQSLVSSFEEILGAYHMNVSSVGVNSLNMSLNGGKLELTAEIKAQFSGKATIKGEVNYESNAKKMSIKISEVKFGILNVTNQVFEELKRHQTEKFKVNKPYLHVLLN